MEILNYFKNSTLNIDDLNEFEQMRKYFYDMGIKTCYENKINSKNRILFTNLHKNTNYYNKYNLEANGFVLEINTWKPLVIPIPNFTTYIKNCKHVDFCILKNLYNIYEIEEGTIINLYFWNNKWVISTTNGYEVNHLVWAGISYEKALNDILSYLKINDFYDCLDKNKCYTFGFKHPQFHPFWENKHKPVYKLWFVRDVNLQNLKINYDISPHKYIKLQKKIDFMIRNTKDILNCSFRAFNEFNKTNKIFYGFILRSKNTFVTKHNSNILIESNLLKYIKKLFYDKDVNSYIQQNNYDRILFLTLRAFLNNNYTNIFNTLFPQFNEIMNNCNIIRNKFINNIKHVYLKKIDKTIEKKSLNLYQLFAISMFEEMKKFYNINNNNNNMYSENDMNHIIKDFITHESLIEKYYQLYIYEQTNKDMNKKTENILKRYL